MEKNILHSYIEDLIGKISRKHAEIKNPDVSVSRIDKDILLADLRTLYELCSELDKIPSKNITEVKIETPLPVENIEPVDKENFISETFETESSLIGEQKEVELLNQKTSMPSPVNLFGESTTNPKKLPEKESVHDKMKSEDKSLASKLMKKPIKDLKVAIGINEKFIFLNELFDGNGIEYNTAVDTLNKLNSFQEADEWLNMHCVDQHKWNLKNKFVKKDFYELVQRRFL